MKNNNKYQIYNDIIYKLFFFFVSKFFMAARSSFMKVELLKFLTIMVVVQLIQEIIYPKMMLTIGWIT